LLQVDGLRVQYADAPHPALADVSLSLAAGEFMALVGPSGSGKTTLLRCVAGLQRPTAGEIRLDGEPIDGVPPALGVVFQEYGRSLFPWLTARANVELPLRHLGLPRVERRERAASALAEVGLAAVADRHPWQLSGGMQQRVAIARAIAYAPRILLMDEPFASVDAQTRADLQDLLLTVWRRHDSTVLFVTHDIDESLYLSDRVVLLSRPPTVVEAEISVALPRPRNQIDTRASDAFVALRSELATRLMRPDASGPAR